MERGEEDPLLSKPIIWRFSQHLHRLFDESLERSRIEMDIESIIQDLTEGKVFKRRIDGEFRLKNKTYNFKAYRISSPQNIIRIDIEEAK